MIFDLLREGEIDWRLRPLTERRAALELLLGGGRSPVLCLSEQVRGDGRAMHARAAAEGWEGLIAKRANSTYRSGKRTPDWRKLKIVHEQEFVIGGWTEPRQSRSHFGALIVGVYADRSGPARPTRAARPASRARPASPLTYAGHVGTGFDERELARVMKLLKPLESKTCPFSVEPPANERAHWVRPTLVAQVRFAEWTTDGNLRHPVYLGLRDDKDATTVRREKENEVRDLLDQLLAIEKSRRDGVLELPKGRRLKVTNLHKVFWPRQKLTKGDLFRYYVQVAPFILPVIADRPLVMKRFPNGVAEKPFYQHLVEDVAAGVRVETARGAEHRPQLVGGDLLTLLYTTQLAAISQDPWFSRIGSIECADFVALDLDPAPGVEFTRVLGVARRIRDELGRLGATSVVKTSGADGVHIYVPLRADTPYEAGLLFARIVATIVAQKAPKEATIERSVRARGSRVYVDYLQNILGKTLASAYSARASDYAGVSTPLTWDEIDRGVRREDFTMTSVPARLVEVGDLWAALRESRGVDLSAIANATHGAAPSRPRKR